MQKDFQKWNELKQKLYYEDKKVYFREKEIKKYSKDVCFILPFSTQIKISNPWYQITVDIKGKQNAINITHKENDCT